MTPSSFLLRPPQTQQQINHQHDVCSSFQCVSDEEKISISGLTGFTGWWGTCWLMVQSNESTLQQTAC